MRTSSEARCSRSGTSSRLGHRRIALLGGRPDLESAHLREAGYRRALAEAGIPFDPELVGVGHYRHDASLEPARAFLALADPPTAVFAANDASAIAVVEVARELGASRFRSGSRSSASTTCPTPRGSCRPSRRSGSPCTASAARRRAP